MENEQLIEMLWTLIPAPFNQFIILGILIFLGVLFVIALILGIIYKLKKIAQIRCEINPHHSKCRII